ncbi:MAG: ROK family glucokinase [Clostridia bacterium]|nr:ROK family glucokinase [Clostridia bacterium]
MVRIGIDLGGTNIVAGVVNDEHAILAKAECKTNLPRPAEAIMDDMARLAKEAVANAGLTMEDVEFVGVGCPGTCNVNTGIVEYSCNLDFKEVPLQAELQARVGKPVYIENDANAAALGETVAGAAKGANNALCITLGTGVGGGIIIDGKIYDGFNCAAAELGHIVIVCGGEQCGCGREGCWEAYASATALIRQTKAAIDAHPDSRLAQIAAEYGHVSGRTAFDAMRDGCPIGQAVVDQYIFYLASGLTNMVNIFQPEVLCIGGGISREGDTLLKPVMAHIERDRYSKYSKHQTRLCAAALGNDAGIIGAAYLGKQ